MLDERLQPNGNSEDKNELRMTSEWKGALRLQIEALAKRNDLHRRCVRESVQRRTKEMDQKIIKMRELLSTDANQAAQFYLECVCHADETERILSRTSSREKRHRGENGALRYISSFEAAPGARSIASSSAVEVISPEALPSTISRGRWWNIHRKDEYYDERKHEVRQLWNSQTDFLSHAMALVVGVGNVIRFPAAIYRSGGIFLFPYLVLHLLVGFPVVFLQLTIGQFAALGPPAVLGRLASAASGIGWTLVLMAVPFCLYFNAYAAWSLFYLTEILFSSVTPWQKCERAFNSSRTCCPIDQLEACQGSNTTVLSTETFLHSTILHVAGSSMGSLQPPLVAGLAFAWLLTIAIYFKPSPTTHFTASFPFFVLILLSLCGSSLPGASAGLSYLFSFNLRKIYSLEVWLFALEQVLFELALCGGPLFSLAALNRFRNNVFRDSAILTSSTVICSLLSAIVVFSFAGNLSTLAGIPMSRLVAYDFRYFSLIVLPSMTSTVQGGTFWFSLLFVALTLAVIDAQYSWLRLLTSTLLTKLGSKNQRLDARMFCAFAAVGFLCSLPFCTLGGVYLFHSIDCLISNWTVTLTLSLLLILISHIYGVNNFLRDLSCMLRIPLHFRWTLLTADQRVTFLFGPTSILVKYCWSVITPSILLLSTVFFLVNRERIKFARNPVPLPYELVAWLLVSSPLAAIPILFGFRVFKARQTGKTFKSLFDGSKWSQLDQSQLESEPEPEEPLSTKKRRTATREHTYIYIDPVSRGNTERSVTAIQVEDNYGWRVGRLKEVQEDPSLRPSESQNSFDMSITSQGTAKEITLFGSPPASNAFIMSEAIRARAVANRRQRAFSTTESVPQALGSQLTVDAYNKASSISEPPAVPNTPPPRSSPCAKSEPPRARPDRPCSSIRSKSECSDSDDEDSEGIKPQRVTVIRRYYSTDSVGLQSNTSISITPCDRLTEVDRQRSMSSLAIYDPQTESRPRQTLSQLKRPQPINAPPDKSPTRF